MMLKMAACTFSASVLAFCATHSALAQGDPARDWLVADGPYVAKVLETPERHEVNLTNGLVTRTFRTAPDFATISFVNETTGAQIVRGVKPEAAMTLDDKRYEIGGLQGQPDYAYLDPAWLDAMTANAEAFHFSGYRISPPGAMYPWQPKRHAPWGQWPPRGVRLTIDFAPPANAPAAHAGVRVQVIYELYDNLPLVAKWVVVQNSGPQETTLAALECEILAVTEFECGRLHVESNYAFHTMNTTQWGPDKEYTTQVDYENTSPVLMTSRYPKGPGVHLEASGAFESFRTLVLSHDSDDRERRGMARQRLYRALAPQSMENPILMHVRDSKPEAVRLAIDQCAEVGFEMVICTFWSGFDIESEDPAYIAQFKELADYAHIRGVELGGYTLMCASRDVGADANCISPDTGKPGSMFGQSACLASAWADGYFKRVLHFLDATGIDVIETDGPYHGDVCASTTHAHHVGLADSQYAQWHACCTFYHKLRERGIYINTPDWYYLNGSNKCALGYKEVNWSLPRERQVVIARQEIFDGTFEKTPSMGWMFVPLVEYHGGGAAATLEPLSEHLAEYEWHLAQNFGSGVQACYRGPRLYDTDATKAVVKKWVDFYKRHRAILDSDLLHLRRADGRSIDYMMHVNPKLQERALAMIYNPAPEVQATTVHLPLYYAGLTDKATVREQDGAPTSYALDRDFSIDVPVRMAAKSITWLVIE